MSTTVHIRGIPVIFPFEPYSIQKDYMEKVIDCLQSSTNGVLESPTGTGKTLSLLCSSLAWLTSMKDQRKALFTQFENQEGDPSKEINIHAVKAAFMGTPKIIYSSRTHSQLSQAMQELKRTSYSTMKTSILGSRDQFCIHEELANESGNTKNHLCQAKLKARQCYFYNNLERNKYIPNEGIMDIEDLVKAGRKHRYCPYFMAKEAVSTADIIFTPYNYLLDPKIRKSLGLSLGGNIVILDEAHNIESVCETSASIEIKSTDITACIEEVTEVMKVVSDDVLDDCPLFTDTPPDFSADELCLLKQVLLDFERTVDSTEVSSDTNNIRAFEGDYIFELLEKSGVTVDNCMLLEGLMDRIIRFLSTVKNGPFQGKGNGLELFQTLLFTAYGDRVSQYRDKIKKCYKVHISIDKPMKKNEDNWLSKATAKKACRILNFWCFSPSFGMSTLISSGVKCVILTSGTLSPLPPLISELGLQSPITLENPHIVGDSQVCVEIVTRGPDNELLNCSYQNRDNLNYIHSLGRSILNLARMIPHGLLVFFPSYPIMQKCQNEWQSTGTWANICQVKSIFTEPKDKRSFNEAMSEYYKRIRDPSCKGAIFMGVLRGKVAEGLDFADINGRGVIITGLPYPPLRDPRVTLKRRYSTIRDTSNNKIVIDWYIKPCASQRFLNYKSYHPFRMKNLTGDKWYSLEATRAVNQAIGRVIRHRHDYGVILLLDSRFDNFNVKANLSMWVRNRIKVADRFGQVVGHLRDFFKNAKVNLPEPKLPPLRGENQSPVVPASFEIPEKRKIGNFDFSTSQASSSSYIATYNNTAQTASKSTPNETKYIVKRRKLTVISNQTTEVVNEEDSKAYIIMVKKELSPNDFKTFIDAVTAYNKNFDFKELCKKLDQIFIDKYSLRYLIPGLMPYIKKEDRDSFEEYWRNMR